MKLWVYIPWSYFLILAFFFFLILRGHSSLILTSIVKLQGHQRNHFSARQIREDICIHTWILVILVTYCKSKGSLTFCSSPSVRNSYFGGASLFSSNLCLKTLLKSIPVTLFRMSWTGLSKNTGAGSQSAGAKYINFKRWRNFAIYMKSAIFFTESNGDSPCTPFQIFWYMNI